MSFTQSSLGQGQKGVAPKITGATVNASVITQDRKTMRMAFPTTTTVDGNFILTNKFPQTPFRLAMNAGDYKSRVNSTDTNVNSANQRFVYDSSDYVRFKKLQSKNRNYNDKAF